MMFINKTTQISKVELRYARPVNTSVPQGVKGFIIDIYISPSKAVKKSFNPIIRLIKGVEHIKGH